MLLSYVKDNHNANEIIVVPSIGYYTDQYGIGEIPRVTRPAADIQHRLLLRLVGSAAGSGRFVEREFWLSD